jgi:hypothetical protein
MDHKHADGAVVFCLMSKAGKLKFGYCKDYILILNILLGNKQLYLRPHQKSSCS